LLKSALQLPEIGEKNIKEGDEEEAYLFFMKFVYLAVEAKKMPEPKRTQLKPLISNSKLKVCMDQAEILTKSLERRYKSMAEEKSLQDAAFMLAQTPLEMPTAPHNGFAGANGNLICLLIDI